MKPFFTYMLRCADGSYYTGHTDDLEERVLEHMAGDIPCYTVKRRPVELVWYAEFTTREDALERELQIKGWSRAKKEALIREDWGRLNQLARGPDRVLSPRSPFDYGPGGATPSDAMTGPYAQGERGARNA